MDVFPDFDGLAGISDLREVVGALLMFALIIAVLMLISRNPVWIRVNRPAALGLPFHPGG